MYYPAVCIIKSTISNQGVSNSLSLGHFQTYWPASGPIFLFGVEVLVRGAARTSTSTPNKGGGILVRYSVQAIVRPEMVLARRVSGRSTTITIVILSASLPNWLFGVLY